MFSKQGQRVSLRTPLAARSNTPITRSRANTQLPTPSSLRNQYLQQDLDQAEERELDVIGNLTLSNAKLEDRVLELERVGSLLRERVKELEIQREKDVNMLVRLRVEIATWWKWWGESRFGGGVSVQGS